MVILEHSRICFIIISYVHRFPSAILLNQPAIFFKVYYSSSASYLASPPYQMSLWTVFSQNWSTEPVGATGSGTVCWHENLKRLVCKIKSSHMETVSTMNNREGFVQAASINRVCLS